MIVVTKEGYELRLSGHAGAAPYGEDIVCAAVSALFCTLAGGISAHEELFERTPVVYLRSGDSFVQCEPKAECRETVDVLYDVFLSGIYSIAIQHPENLKIIIKS